VYCHAGCSQDAVIDALRDRGMWPDRPKTNGETKPRVTIVAIYDYVDTDDTAAIVSNVMTAADVPKWQLLSRQKYRLHQEP
jgi:hypothetical protein